MIEQIKLLLEYVFLNVMKYCTSMGTRLSCVMQILSRFDWAGVSDTTKERLLEWSAAAPVTMGAILVEISLAHERESI